MHWTMSVGVTFPSDRLFAPSEGSGVRLRPVLLGDRYELLEELAVGGTSHVYAAWDRVDRVEVALKMLRPELAATPRCAARFEREIEVLEALDDPGIVRIRDEGRTDDSRYVVTELLRGETLSALLRRAGPLDDAELAAVMFGLCDALEVAHAAGVIHRDLKPANVFFTEDGQIKLLDFGAAHVVGSCERFGEGRRVGTPRFMAPEQILGEEVDARTDVYSVGVLAYEALTGRAAFPGGVREACRAIVRGEVEPLGELRPDLPDHVVAAVERAMAVDPAARFATAAEFAAALEG